MTPAIAQYRPALIIVTFHGLCHVAEEAYNSFQLSRPRQEDVPALSASEEQAIFTLANYLDVSNWSSS